MSMWEMGTIVEKFNSKYILIISDHFLIKKLPSITEILDGK